MEIFKNTDKEFKKLKIRDICQVKTGKRDANEQSENGTYTFFTCGKQNSKANFFDFDCEAILIAGNGNSLGFTQYYEGKFTAYQRTYVLKDFGEHNAKYLYYYLKFFFLNRIKRSIQGAAVNYIRIDDILDFEIDYPVHNNDVEKIANFLSERESYLQSIQTLISKMEQRNQYYLHGLMNGSLTLNNNRVEEYDGTWKNFRIFNRDISVPEKFNPVKLSEMDNIEMGRGKVISKKDIENSEGAYPIYSSSVLNNGYFGRYSEYLFDEEMITWSVDGGGNFFYRPKHKFSITNVCGYIKPTNNLIETKYFYYLLKMQHSKFSFDYSNKAHPSSIKEMYYFTNASLEEQKEVARFLSKNEDEVNLVIELYSKEKQVFQWLCEKLISGEYRI